MKYGKLEDGVMSRLTLRAELLSYPITYDAIYLCNNV